jgi:hypothetical protein
MIENIASFLNELKVGARSLSRAKGLTITVVVTLALGIGANAAMFSLLRGVLLRPLVNRDEDRLIYIQQTSAGSNATFSVPEISDLRSRVKTLSSFGDFSALSFTLVGLGERCAKVVPTWAFVVSIATPSPLTSTVDTLWPTSMVTLVVTVRFNSTLRLFTSTLVNPVAVTSSL